MSCILIEIIWWNESIYEIAGAIYLNIVFQTFRFTLCWAGKRICGSYGKLYFLFEVHSIQNKKKMHLVYKASWIDLEGDQTNRPTKKCHPVYISSAQQAKTRVFMKQWQRPHKLPRKCVNGWNLIVLLWIWIRQSLQILHSWRAAAWQKKMEVKVLLNSIHKRLEQHSTLRDHKNFEWLPWPSG